MRRDNTEPRPFMLSQKGCRKINVRGYLMTKERNRENKFY